MLHSLAPHSSFHLKEVVESNESDISLCSAQAMETFTVGFLLACRDDVSFFRDTDSDKKDVEVN